MYPILSSKGVSYFEDDVAHLYRKVHKDTTNVAKTKKTDNIAPPNTISG